MKKNVAMVPTARVEAFHIHKANKRRKKGKKNKPRGNKIKRGPDENVDRENHLKRFEDFSRLHILEGEKERERYAGDGIVYRARFVTVRFTRKAQHLS